MAINETPYGQPRPPKTITRIKSDRFLDLTNLHTWVLFAAVAACMYFFRLMANGITQLLIFIRTPEYSQPGAGQVLTHAYLDIAMYAVLIVFVVYIWVKYFRSDDLVEFQKDRLVFFLGDITGKHVIDTMAASMNTLYKLLAIVDVHKSTIDNEKVSNAPKGAIIEFGRHTSFLMKLKIFFRIERQKLNEFGVLIETFPPRISDEFREYHELTLQRVVNGLPVNTLFENISCSVAEPRKQVLEYLLTLMNSSKGEASDQHLADMYLKISQDESPVIKWRYFSFISLGEFKSITQARIQYGAVIPGLILSMQAASLCPVILPNSKAVTAAYNVMLGDVNV